MVDRNDYNTGFIQPLMVNGNLWFTISDSRFMVQGSGLMVNERAISTVHHQSISRYTAGGL